MVGIYAHIPFCKSRCAYCDFYSTTREAEKEAYVRALCREMEARRDEANGETVGTIYIGGGTPSVLSASQLERIECGIREHYDVEENVEFTVEMNPDDSVHVLADITVNRVSLGIQTFDDGLLGLIRRRHNAARAVAAVKELQDAGISNISIDLIYGLPGQTLQTWEHDLDVAFGLHVQHLSAYALSYEDGTPLTRWRQQGSVQEVPEEVQVQMYERLCERARAEGFEHYEISNFARPGFHSRHNNIYWMGGPYMGFGPGAHSYDGCFLRRANHQDLTGYLEAMNHHNVKDQKWFTEETLSVIEQFNEAVMCGLRTCSGVDVEHIGERFGQVRQADLIRMAAPHLEAGRLVLQDGHLLLTSHALMTSDDVMSDLMMLGN